MATIDPRTPEGERIGMSRYCDHLERRIADLERALWVALNGREVVVRDDTPRLIEWRDTEDGGRLARRIT